MESRRNSYIATFGRKQPNKLPYITHEVCDIYVSSIHCSISWDEKNFWRLKE